MLNIVVHFKLGVAPQNIHTKATFNDFFLTLIPVIYDKLVKKIYTTVRVTHFVHCN